MAAVDEKQNNLKIAKHRQDKKYLTICDSKLFIYLATVHSSFTPPA
jgi:hypothetical protein